MRSVPITNRPLTRDRSLALSGRWIRLALLVAGFGVSCLMVFRSQVGGDQIALLSRGWMLAAKGILIPHGNPAAVGFEPGPMTSLVVGLPLQLWMDPRAPVILILLLHVVAYVLIDRVVREECGENGRLLLIVFYWLNPWRLYFSGFLWDPNYMFLPGATLLWACHRQRLAPRFLHSTLLVIAVGFALQLHLAAVSLVFAGALLWWRKYWKPHWGGVVAGAVIVLVSLLPWIIEIASAPELRPGQRGFFGRGIILVYPVLRGISYWFRYGSLYSSSKWMTEFDFEPALGESADAVLAPVFWTLKAIIGPMTILLTLVAHRFMWQNRERAKAPPGSVTKTPDWLHGYFLWVAAGTLLAYSAAQTTVMMWMGLAIQHAAVLPLVLCGTTLLNSSHRTIAVRIVQVYALLSLVLLGGMSIGSAMYRRGGEDRVDFTFPAHHEILQDLRLDERYSVGIDRKGGQWPRGLPGFKDFGGPEVPEVR